MGKPQKSYQQFKWEKKTHLIQLSSENKKSRLEIFVAMTKLLQGSGRQNWCKVKIMEKSINNIFTLFKYIP